MRFLNCVKLVFLLFLFSFDAQAFKKKKIEVHADKDLELLFCVYNQIWTPFLDQNVSESMLANTKLMQYNYHYFKANKNHKAVQLSRDIMQRCGTDFFLFAFYYEIFPAVKRVKEIPHVILKDINPSSELALSEIDTLMREISNFAKVSGFESFFKQHKYVYNKAIKEVSSNLPDQRFLPFMESYFGRSDNSYHFIVIPFFKAEFGMAHQIKKGDLRDNYSFIAPFIPAELDSNQVVQKVGYNSKPHVLEWVIHEYAHVFFNHHLLMPEMLTELERFKHLYKPIENSPQIGNWVSMFAEHLAVAFEVRAAHLLGDTQRKEDLLERHKHWPYLEHFIAQLVNYESNRAKYTDIAAFIPVLIASCQELKQTGTVEPSK